MTGCEPTEVKKLINKSTGETVMLCQHGNHPNVRCYDCFPVALNKMDEVNNASTKSLFERIEALEKELTEYKNNKHMFYNEFENTTLELREKIEALERYGDKVSGWVIQRTLIENSIHLRVDLLEQERDKGVQRLKYLEELEIQRRSAYQTLSERLEALESRQSPEQYNKVETAPELQDELRLSQQNPVTDVAQKELITDFGKNFCDQMIKSGRSPYFPFQPVDHIADAGKEIRCSKCDDRLFDDGIHTCSPKTVTIFEAIKALREGKNIRLPTWENAFMRKDDSSVFSVDMLLADDWIIKDANN